MKRMILTAINLLGIIALITAQQIQDVREFNINTSSLQSLRIYNHEGAVSVKGVDGNQAKLKITRKIQSSSRDRLTKAREEIYIDTISDAGNLYFFIEAPDRLFKIDVEGHAGYNSWNYQNRKSELRHFKLNYSFTWEVEVPNHLIVHASTHRKKLRVDNMKNKVVACNHHDDVDISNLSGDVDASSHHGDVTVAFSKNPKNSVDCHTHHGDIKVALQDGLGADVRMKSHHGKFYTDFDWKAMPMKVNREDGKSGTRYKWGNGTMVRIGSGGIEMNFKTHHGDVFLTK